MKKHLVAKKGFFALTLYVSFAYPMLILSAASSSSCAIEPQEQETRTELQQRLAALQALQIDPFLAQRKPKSLAEIAHGFAQRTLQEYEYAALNAKYLLPKEEPAKCMEGITGRFSLRYKIIGKLFQEHQEGRLSFEDLFAIAQHHDSLSQLASFVYFALHKETTWDDETIWIDNETFGPWEWPQKMCYYPKELIPYLGIALEEYIAHNKAPSINDSILMSGNELVVEGGNLTSLAGIEAIPGIESVRCLSSRRNKLSTLPDFISNLTELKRLVLSKNQFTTLPYLIDDLAQLDHLEMDFNKLIDLPGFIGNLTKLKSLDLSKNQLTTLPYSIGDLTQLARLYLDSNRFTAMPDSLCNLTNLKDLYLRNNQLTTLPYSISNLTKLARLYLDSNRFTALPDSLCNLTGLKHLYLSNNQLTALPYSIGDLTQLALLDLHNNQLTTLPDSIRNLTNLQYLNLHNNNFSQTERNRITLMINQATAGQCKISWL